MATSAAQAPVAGPSQNTCRLQRTVQRKTEDGWCPNDIRVNAMRMHIPCMDRQQLNRFILEGAYLGQDL